MSVGILFKNIAPMASWNNSQNTTVRIKISKKMVFFFLI